MLFMAIFGSFQYKEKNKSMINNLGLDCRKDRFHLSDLEGINQSNAQITHFSNIQDMFSEGW
jgi:hypothetical protein